MNKNQRKLNSSGFSLVELIIAIAILGIVGTIIMFFVSSGTKQYSKTGNSVKLQNEAQLAMDLIQELVIDATDGVSYEVNGTLVTGEAVSSTDEKRLLIYNKETAATVSGGAVSTQYSCLEVKWVPAEQKLYYAQYDLEKPDSLLSSTWTWTDVVVNDLLAEYVTDFSIDLSKLETNHMVSVEMDFQVGNETFHAQKNINVRNSVVVNGEQESDIYQ